MKSAKRPVFDATARALWALVEERRSATAGEAIGAAWSACSVLRDASEGQVAGQPEGEDLDPAPPALRLQSPTEVSDESSKSTVWPELTITIRITAQSEYAVEALSSAVTERLSKAPDLSHRIDLDGTGFQVREQAKDNPDVILNEPTGAGLVAGILQRYRFRLATLSGAYA